MIGYSMEYILRGGPFRESPGGALAWADKLNDLLQREPPPGFHKAHHVFLVRVISKGDRYERIRLYRWNGKSWVRINRRKIR